jgi:hypothetical protein
MLARTPLREAMITWLEGKDPEERYDWGDRDGCACAQFAKATGRWDEWQGLLVERRSLGSLRLSGSLASLIEREPEWVWLNEVARGGVANGGAHWSSEEGWKFERAKGWTFGALLERLREASECCRILLTSS